MSHIEVLKMLESDKRDFWNINYGSFLVFFFGNFTGLLAKIFSPNEIDFSTLVLLITTMGSFFAFIFTYFNRKYILHFLRIEIAEKMGNYNV